MHVMSSAAVLRFPHNMKRLPLVFPDDESDGEFYTRPSFCSIVCLCVRPFVVCALIDCGPLLVILGLLAPRCWSDLVQFPTSRCFGPRAINVLKYALCRSLPSSLRQICLLMIAHLLVCMHAFCVHNFSTPAVFPG